MLLWLLSQATEGTNARGRNRHQLPDKIPGSEIGGGMEGCNEVRVVDGCLFPRGSMRPTQLPLNFLRIVYKDWRTTNGRRAKCAKDDGKILIAVPDGSCLVFRSSAGRDVNKGRHRLQDRCCSIKVREKSRKGRSRAGENPFRPAV